MSYNDDDDDDDELKLKGYCAVFFANRVINRWNALDQSAVDAHSINAFKQTIVKVRNNRMGFFMD